MITKELAVAAGAIPATLFLMSNIAGATSSMNNHSNGKPVREALAMTAAALLVASIATGSAATTVTTGLAVGASFYLFRNIWDIPSLSEVNPL